MIINDIPKDVIQDLFYTYLSYRELKNCSCVCKNWKGIYTEIVKKLLESKTADRVLWDNFWKKNFATLMAIDYQQFSRIQRIYRQQNARLLAQKPGSKVTSKEYAFESVKLFFTVIEAQEKEDKKVVLKRIDKDWKFKILHVCFFRDRAIGVTFHEVSDVQPFATIVCWELTNCAVLWHKKIETAFSLGYINVLNQKGFPAVYLCSEKQSTFFLFDADNGKIICEHTIDAGSFTPKQDNYPLTDLENAFFITDFCKKKIYQIGELTDLQREIIENSMQNRSLISKACAWGSGTLSQLFSKK